ncbi:MAG: ABC transporter ATP-binding protein [Candidatus Hodarchaeales archaeon]
MVSISLIDVNKRFGKVLTLPKLSLEIRDKEFMVLVGPSGCGKSTTKSTTLNLIAGLEFVTDGQILFNDQDVTIVSPKERKVAMVFQSYALYPHMNVYDNMAFGLKLAKTPKEEIDRRIREASEILEIEELLDRKPKDMSGGQRQRVALGRAVVRDPSVFLFDEPLSNLDAKLRVQTRGEIIKLHKRLQTTLVYVTHDQVEAMSMADRICILDKGDIQQVGSPTEVYDTPANMFVAGFIGSPAMNFLKGKLVGDVLNLGPIQYKLSSDLHNKVSNYSDLYFGIRPEHINISPEGEGFEGTVSAGGVCVCSVVEFLGADSLITLEIAPKMNLLALIDGHFEGKVGDKVFISWKDDKVHLFDPESEKNLVHQI